MKLSSAFIVLGSFHYEASAHSIDKPIFSKKAKAEKETHCKLRVASYEGLRAVQVFPSNSQPYIFLVSVSGAAFSKAGKAENPDVLGKVAKTGVVDTKAAKSGGKKKHNFCWVGCKLYTSFVANHVFS